nr:zinc finger, CCHC-type [Tanacetum cinerariifolium]
MAVAMKHMVSSFAKLEKFDGVDFKRWKKKMHFMISNMSVMYVLTTLMPENGGENPTVEQVRKRAKWDNDDYVCRAKYMTEDALSKKFLVSNFTNYKMTDSRPVLEQYNELLRILGRFTQHKMNMDESIQIELSAAEAIQADYDVKATNIILQGLPLEVYALVNTKFLNTLPPEWSKFVTDVKLVRDLHTTNIDQLHAYLGQHEYHANEVRLMHEHTSDPLAVVAQHQMNKSTYQQHQQSYHQHQFQPSSSIYQSSSYATQYHPPQYASQAPSSSNLSISYLPNDTQSSVNHNVYMASSLIPQMEYAPTVHQQSEFSSPETGLVVPVFQKGDDHIDAINHMMSFLTAVVTSRYSATNNQLRTSSNPRQQATINNERVTIQPIQGRQNSVTAGSSRPYASGSSGASGKQRVIVCYNCKGKGHMSKQCTKLKKKRDAKWFKDKVLLVQAQANGQVL